MTVRRSREMERMNEGRCRLVAAAALAGDAAPLRALPEDDQRVLVRWLVDQRLSALLLSACPASSEFELVRTALSTAARREALLTALQERELQRVLAALGDAAIAPVLLKGAVLAYTVYPNAALRPRNDSDFMIRDGDAPRVRAVLESLGYEHAIETQGTLIRSQFQYTRTEASGLRHACDVHLKLTNPQAYADALTYDELRADAVRLPALHAAALGTSPIHSLVIASIHRIAHHYDDDDLAWLWDIHLLAKALDAGAWERVLVLARQKQLFGVIAHGLERARLTFGDAGCDDVTRQLARAAREEPPSPLMSSRTVLDVALSDSAALPTWTARWELWRQHLFPPLSYLRARYPGCPAALLPFAYAYRIGRGAPKWLRGGHEKAVQ